eukprot:455786-Pelagomonas_calceolata.AAC.5
MRRDACVPVHKQERPVMASRLTFLPACNQQDNHACILLSPFVTALPASNAPRAPPLGCTL